MKQRPPQLDLRLDLAAPDLAAQWRDGARIAYLGGDIALKLDTYYREAHLEQGVLHLPLPPEASARQIQDRAEAWLREEAQRLLAYCAERHARRLGRNGSVAVGISFAVRASWVQGDGRGGLRCNWRLIEQPMVVIEQVIGSAVAALPAAGGTPDLFACAA